MNLYFRLLIILFKSKFARRIDAMQDVLSLSDEHIEVPAKPVNVGYWQKLLQAKKELHKNKLTLSGTMTL